MANFCDILSELRRDRHLTQRQMAKILHVSAGTISNYETGRFVPSYETLVKLADYFDVTTDYLLGRTNSSLSVKKLGDEFVPGKTFGDVLETLISFHDKSRDVANTVIDVIRIYNAVSQPDGGKTLKK
jgi:transcriptional regulator with XRE-family HTH domain